MEKIVEEAERQLELNEGNEPKKEKEAEVRSEVMTMVTTEEGTLTLKIEKGTVENE